MVKETKRLFLFGINPVMEKLKGSPQEVHQIMLIRGAHRSALRSIDEEARRRGLPVRYVESRLLDHLAEGRKHQGVIAEVGAYSYGVFAELLRDLSSSPGKGWILALDGLTDPRNFGALLRCAEGVGVRHVVIPKDRSVGVTPAVVKTSAGAVYHLNIYRVSNLRRAILTLKERGYWVIGLDARAKESVYGRIYPERLVVVLGAEGTGIRPVIRQECDFMVSIPMRGKIASLNAAVAGGIFFYELLRQKGEF